MKWEDIKKHWDLPDYSKRFGYFFFSRRVQQVCLWWIDLPWTAVVQLPSCNTLQKSCCKEESEGADCGSTVGMDVVSNVLPGMRSELALVGVNIFAKSNIIYLPQGPALSPTVTPHNRAGDACRQFYFHRTVRQVHPREQKYHNYTIIWWFKN